MNNNMVTIPNNAEIDVILEKLKTLKDEDE